MKKFGYKIGNKVSRKDTSDVEELENIFRTEKKIPMPDVKLPKAEEYQILKVIMRKIEGSEKDYELITEIDEAFETLSDESVEAINGISEEYVKFVQEVIRLDSKNKEEK